MRRIQVIDFKSHDYRLFRDAWQTEIVIAHDVEDASNISDAEYALNEVFLRALISTYRLVSHDVDIILPDDLKRDLLIKMVATHQYHQDDYSLSAALRLTQSRGLRYGINYT